MGINLPNKSAPLSELKGSFFGIGSVFRLESDKSSSISRTGICQLKKLIFFLIWY